MSIGLDVPCTPASGAPASTPPRSTGRHRPASTHAVVPALPTAVPFSGLSIVPLSQRELIDTLVARAVGRIPSRVHYVNTHVFNLARRDAELKRLLADCDLLYADGIGIVWAARLMGLALHERLTAADYFRTFCRSCSDRGLRLFFLGGAAGIADIAAERLCREIPGLSVAGTSHGYLSRRESADVVRRINDSGADVLLVGMSSPGQERWIADQGSRTVVPVQWSVGALFDYVAGAEPRAPQWLCRIHGEWCFRFWVDPRNRWQRYVAGNLRFAGWLAGEWCRSGRGVRNIGHRR